MTKFDKASLCENDKKVFHQYSVKGGDACLVW